MILPGEVQYQLLYEYQGITLLGREFNTQVQTVPGESGVTGRVQSVSPHYHSVVANLLYGTFSPRARFSIVKPIYRSKIYFVHVKKTTEGVDVSCKTCIKRCLVSHSHHKNKIR
uniref:Uncharacterized protein n=1 Tax=Cacopsylla melanoneura TaxID=428564 RepID=A0A8D9F5Y4_9HEMI